MTFSGNLVPFFTLSDLLTVNDVESKLDPYIISGRNVAHGL